IAAIVVMIVSLILPGAGLAKSKSEVSHSLNDSRELQEQKVNERLLESFKDDEFVTFLVKFTDKAAVEDVAKKMREDAAKSNLSLSQAEHMQRSAVIAELKETSFASQQHVTEYIEQEIE